MTKKKRPWKLLEASRADKRAIAKANEHRRLKEAMAPRPKPPPQKGTHYHEPDDDRGLDPEAQWIKDGGWSGKR